MAGHTRTCEPRFSRHIPYSISRHQTRIRAITISQCLIVLKGLSRALQNAVSSNLTGSVRPGSKHIATQIITTFVPRRLLILYEVYIYGEPFGNVAVTVGNNPSCGLQHLAHDSPGQLGKRAASSCTGMRGAGRPPSPSQTSVLPTWRPGVKARPVGSDCSEGRKSALATAVSIYGVPFSKKVQSSCLFVSSFSYRAWFCSRLLGVCLSFTPGLSLSLSGGPSDRVEYRRQTVQSATKTYQQPCGFPHSAPCTNIACIGVSLSAPDRPLVTLTMLKLGLACALP